MQSLTISLLSLLLSTSYLTADIASLPPQEETTEERISVGSRPLDPELKEMLLKQRAQSQDTSEPEQQSLFRQTKATFDNAQPQFQLAPAQGRPQITLAAYYPVNSHWLNGIDLDYSVELEDGSHWKVVSSDIYVMNTWRRGDNLVITPNTYWFSTGDYYITNKSNNTYVKANLHLGPVAYGPYSHWIVQIDHASGHVGLENGMTWCVSGDDWVAFREWEVNDHIIIGINDSWFSSYGHVLINVNMDNYVRSKQY